MVEFGVLGPLVASRGIRRLELGSAKTRALLASLLVHPNRVVSADHLITAIWGEERLANPLHTLHVYVSRLRQALADLGETGVLVSKPPGYLLRVDLAGFDLAQFGNSVDAARKAVRAGKDVECLDHLEAALGLWRGPALADVDRPFASSERVRLEGRRLDALEDRFDALGRLGRDGETLAELSRIAAAHPLRERLQAQLMVALYRAGRQSEASDVYQAIRRRLAEELGMEPGPNLQKALTSILKHQVPGTSEPVSLAAEPVIGAVPVRRGTEPSGNLPRMATRFIGRAGQVAKIVILAKEGPLVTLLGPGGIGKTRLAHRAAEEAHATFADGVCWVDLAPVTEASAVVPRIMAAAGFHGAPSGSPLDELITRLSGQDLLLVLDNCEHLALACADLVALIVDRCPRVRVLATSRETLDIAGERVWSVPALTTPSRADLARVEALGTFEAIQLFLERARAIRPDLDLRTEHMAVVAEACQRLDGLPLALELAAGQLFAMSPEEILDRLDRRFRLLLSGARTLPPRHQTMRNAISWSHDLLNPQEQALFRRLSVFSGSFDLDAAEAVCNWEPLEPDQVAGLITSLARKSLLVVESRAGEPTRYRLLETLRHYAAGHLEDAGEASMTKRRHGDTFAALAEPIANHVFGVPKTIQTVQRLDPDHDNATAALEWSEVHAPLLFCRLAANWARYWHVRQRDADALRWLESGLRQPDVNQAQRCLMILPLIEFHTKTGSLDLARRLCEEGILISAQVDDRYLLPRLISSVAWIERSAGDCEAARDRFVEAVELARGLESGLPSLLGDLGECELALGELAAGRRHMAEGRAAADASGDSRISLCSRIGFGHLDRYQGNLESANEALLEAIDLSLAQGNRFLLAEAVRALSFLTAAVGVAENAIRLRAAADAMVREAGASFDPWPFDQEGERLVEDARATLGLDRSQALVGEGTALSLDEILALARSLVLSPRQSVSIVQ